MFTDTDTDTDTDAYAKRDTGTDTSTDTDIDTDTDKDTDSERALMHTSERAESERARPGRWSLEDFRAGACTDTCNV